MLINTTQARLPLTPGRLTHIDLPAHTRVRGMRVVMKVPWIKARR